MNTNYQQKANDFLSANNIKFKATYVDHNFFFANDKETRDIYKLTISRGKNRVSFKFGQSLAHRGQEPTAYDLLETLTKYDPNSFEDFCSEFGYDTDSRKAYKTYLAVCKEWGKVNRFFNSEELEQLQDIN